MLVIPLNMHIGFFNLDNNFFKLLLTDDEFLDVIFNVISILVFLSVIERKAGFTFYWSFFYNFF